MATRGKKPANKESKLIPALCNARRYGAYYDDASPEVRGVCSVANRAGCVNPRPHAVGHTDSAVGIAGECESGQLLAQPFDALDAI